MSAYPDMPKPKKPKKKANANLAKIIHQSPNLQTR
jgi:hypothetical protein